MIVGDPAVRCTRPYSCPSSIWLEFPMVDLPNGKFLGSEEDPLGDTVDAEEAGRFMKCPPCGSMMIALRDLAAVQAHPMLGNTGGRF